MAKPYSNDFRQKVMQAIELDGLKKSEASQLFNISRNTINLWFQRQAATGDIKPKPRQVSQRNLKINDWEKFQAFVKTHGDKTQSEMAELWHEEISQPTISRALGKIKHTRKKNIRVFSKGPSQTSSLFNPTGRPQSTSLGLC
jgi:transposase